MKKWNVDIFGILQGKIMYSLRLPQPSGPRPQHVLNELPDVIAPGVVVGHHISLSSLVLRYTDTQLPAGLPHHLGEVEGALVDLLHSEIVLLHLIVPLFDGVPGSGCMAEVGRVDGEDVLSVGTVGPVL